MTDRLQFTDLAGFFPKQLEAWRYAIDPKYKYILYGGAACFTAETVVLTENGYQEISKIAVGTRVYSLKHNKLELSKVTDKFCYGGQVEQEMIRFVVDGESIICTPSHRFYIDGDWVPASIIHKRILAICGGDKQQLLNLKSRSFTHEELEKYRQGFDNETCTGQEDVFTHSDCAIERSQNGKDSSTSSSGVDSQFRKQTLSESHKWEQMGQPSRKLGMGYRNGELFARKKDGQDEPLTQVYKQKSTIPAKRREKWGVNIDRKTGCRNPQEIYSTKSNTKNIRANIRSVTGDYKRYYSEEKLEARELDIREIDSVQYVVTDGNVYDLEVENVNYIVSRRNIVVHNSGGKSRFLRWSGFGLGLYYANKYNIRDFTIGLFCEDYPTLKDRQISKIRTEFADWMGDVSERQDYGYSFRAAEEYGGFYIVFRNLDDPSKYYSSEFIAILVDELTRNPETTFQDLRFRLRWPGVPDTKFIGATNPGSIGHEFVKKLWITPDTNNLDPEHDKFVYIPSKASDNPVIDPTYLRQLESLPEQKRKALLDGSWDIFAGQVFGEWNSNIHVIDPIQIQDHWKRYMSMDWGVNAPTAVYWYAIDEEGHIYVYREFYLNGDSFKAKYGDEMTPTRVAEKLIEITGKEKINYLVADPACWGKPLGGESVAETMTRMGLPMIEGDNDRLNGLNRVREALSMAPDGKPWVQVFKTCFNLISTLPSLVYDENRIEEVDSSGPDHAYDSVRYFLMSRPAISKAPPEDQSLISIVYKRALKEHNRQYGR